MRLKLALLCAILASALLVWIFSSREQTLLKPIDELKVRITHSSAIPDPTSIVTTGDWYYLDHISSSLAAFDATSKKYIPMIAEKWTQLADGTHVFTLKRNAKFHDGTPITPKDVAWSIKRQLIKRSATHFRLWDYIKGCDKLKNLNDECEGLKVISDREIAFKLNYAVESFYLQMASPETGIFSASDMNPVDASLKPTKFSGPYFVSGIDEKSALLKRNEHSPLSQTFPESPHAIRIVTIPIKNLDQAVKQNEIDLVIRAYRPMGDVNWISSGFRVTETANSSIIYFHGTGTTERKPLSSKFLENLWSMNQDAKISSAETFLPFSGIGTLKRNEVLAELPSAGAKKVRVLNRDGLFAESFLEMVRVAAQKSGTEIEYINVGADEWNAAFDDPKASQKADYILTFYVASERYPTIQLRYMAGTLAKPPIDLSRVESPEARGDRNEVLRDFQKWLVKSRQVIPMFFNRTMLVYQSNIDVGDQSSTDGEVELWRVKQRTQ
jgi:hypothetical protein